MLAECSTRYLTISYFPYRAAQWIGVFPLAFYMFILAAFSPIRYSITFKWPLAEAMCKAVFPEGSS